MSQPFFHVRLSDFPACPRAQRGNTLTGVMLGLVLGVIIAVGVALYINFGRTPLRDTPAPISSPATPAPVAPAASGPAALPGKPGDQANTAQPPNFDFYKILPGGDAASVPAPAKPAVDNTERMFVQAGAFQDPSDADNLKARLALMGIEAGVQKVDVTDKGTFHRVRVGPFTAFGDAEAVRARLATEGIESSIVRSKPQAATSAVNPARP